MLRKDLDVLLNEELGLVRVGDVATNVGGVYTPEADKSYLATIFYHDNDPNSVTDRLVMEFDYIGGYAVGGGSLEPIRVIENVAEKSEYTKVTSPIGHTDHTGTGLGSFNCKTGAIRFYYQPGCNEENVTEDLVAIMKHYDLLLRGGVRRVPIDLTNK